MTRLAQAGWMLGHGYALAGSSYATTGWAIQQALPDQIATLDAFGQVFGTPARTVAWGRSLGDIVTGQPDPALSGPVQRRAADVRRAFRRGGHLEHRAGRRVRLPATDRPLGARRQHHRPLRQPGQRPRGRERRAADRAGPGPAGAGGGAQQRPRLVGAMPLSRPPATTNFAGQEANQFLWDTQVDFPFIFAFRAELEARAGREPVLEHGRELFRRPGELQIQNYILNCYRAAT